MIKPALLIRTALLAAPLLLAACSPPPPGEGDQAPDFTLTSTAGGSVQLSSLRGQIVVLDFWASWCGPCRAAIPALQRIHTDYADRGVRVLGVNLNDSGDPAEFMAKLNADYTVLIKGEQVAAAYAVRGIPTIVIIDPDGAVVHRESGWKSGMDAQLRNVIDAALARADSPVR